MSARGAYARALSVLERADSARLARGREYAQRYDDLAPGRALEERSDRGRVVILRGLPGSGKSTRAREIVARELEGVVVSADDYFTRDGQSYATSFAPWKLGMAHADCMRRFLESIEDGEDLIVVDNTNSQVWEFVNYRLAAELAGYNVEIVVVGQEPSTTTKAEIRAVCARSLHSVPVEACLAMAARWEKS